jgi:ribose 5-phosphate isomerase A
MREQEKKRAAALAALEQVEPGRVIGIGTGSTTNYFIDALGAMRDRVAGAVASSRASAEKLERLGICLVDLNDVDELTLYVDGADEATRRRELIKGGGGALTREKIIAAAAERFICIVDDGKLVERLGVFPLPVEVIPMARRSVGRTIEGLGGRPVLRDNCFTDNGNVILDVHGLTIEDPSALESELNQIPGVVANGLFGRRRADLLLVGEDTGVVAIWDDQE